MNLTATIGFFDGVHRGHQYLFSQLRAQAETRHEQPLIVSFGDHPRHVLCPELELGLLMPMPMRRELLSSYGEVLMLDFESVRRDTAEQFLQTLHDRWQVRTLLMGYDHGFGSDHLRGAEAYREVGNRVGVEIVAVNECDDVQMHVSSTAIRNAVTFGDMDKAAEMLGRPYTLVGQVVHGRALGRELGFPTANLALDEPRQLLPRFGVYAVDVILPDEHTYPAIMNVGINPTVGNSAPSVEIHIPGYEGDLYNHHISVALKRFIRPEQQFGSLQELKNQIEKDVLQVLRYNYHLL